MSKLKNKKKNKKVSKQIKREFILFTGYQHLDVINKLFKDIMEASKTVGENISNCYKYRKCLT